MILPGRLFALRVLTYYLFHSLEPPPGAPITAFWSIPQTPSQNAFLLYVQRNTNIFALWHSPGAPMFDPPRTPVCFMRNEILTLLLSGAPPSQLHLLEHPPRAPFFSTRREILTFCSPGPLELPCLILPEHLFVLRGLTYCHCCSPEHPPGAPILLSGASPAPLPERLCARRALNYSHDCSPEHPWSSHV